MSRTCFSLLTLLSLPLFLSCGGEADSDAGAPEAASVEAGRQIFERTCFACHSIGEGPRIGPDLENIHERREREWLARWIADPLGMAESDPLGRQIFEEWNRVPMAPSFLSDEEIERVIDYIVALSEGQVRRAAAGEEAAEEEPVSLTNREFAQGRQIFFDRCAGCHGTLRAGATGPNIQPERTTQIGTGALVATLTHGLPGGMPAWGDAGILTEEEIRLMARYVQLPPTAPPQRPLEEIRASWELRVPVAQRHSEPETERDWENYFGVILRDAGQVAIIDGDTKELLKIVDTGFAVHILRSSSSGRYFYAVGRDGRVSLIDLWPETPTLVAQAQGCTDARSVDASKYEGYEDRYLIEGCYWPSQYVVFDGLTLEPLQVTSVEGSTYDTGEPLEEVRVAAIVASHFDPVWVLALKESGHVGIVDYSEPGFPLVSRIPAERFLHDGGWDHTGRYFMISANQRNTMAVVDVQEQELVTTFETGIRPHPGRGANWQDPEYGWVNATTHIGQGLLSVYGADPVNRPEHAWKVVRRVPLEGTGSLFLKTHPNSPWVWMDMPMNSDPEGTRKICVYSKAEGRLERCWLLGDRGAAVHFEYNRQGTEVWVSLW
ncbi:MAG: c-type cytochrome, partial [Gemmatimonadetes bacterium]|nr:c-type cytochrome [Gemmatimonadota bacterium]NIR78769.1 c-type cytochrome [Gemmatimonadota bacterium]NIT87403.1 c-type cytochrome [Gemmatimonadota bacterium]NIU31259.1 c-type cytochrome [Gemmatimonadota bacterium]NIU35968.1 c-type cytochrome [Gemmatimonadota bacterium]